MNRELLNDERLARSAVVANCAMNRERQLEGPNSYTRELGFHPLKRLAQREAGPGPARWLDLCCGSGRALVQAADQAGPAEITGVDLVDFFAPVPPSARSPRLVCADATAWEPESRFDLITCVHGLHYIGDKLGLLSRAVGWLADGGLLVADFDAASVRLPDGRPAGRPLSAALREAGFTYDPRRRRVTHDGIRKAPFPYAYLGADDQAGPGYTGQPAVHSYYRRTSGVRQADRAPR